MTDHVSLETAKALRDAGLRHEWQVGDAVAFLPRRPDFWNGIVYRLGWNLLHVARGGEVYRWQMQDCLYLPTSGQCLDLLAARGRVEVNYDADDRWHVLLWMPEAQEWHSHEQLAEAAGQELLAVLVEVQG